MSAWAYSAQAVSGRGVKRGAAWGNGSLPLAAATFTAGVWATTGAGAAGNADAADHGQDHVLRGHADAQPAMRTPMTFTDEIAIT